MNQGGHVLVYAVAAAVSPILVTATFIVLRSERPRGNGIAFLSGLLLGTSIACALGLLSAVPWSSGSTRTERSKRL
jgi:hypothetical protein